MHSGPNREIKEKCVETGETAFQNSSMKTFKEIFVNIFENICWQFEIYLLTFWEIFVNILRNMCWHQRSVGTVRGKRLPPTNLAWKLFVRQRTWRKIYEQTDGSQPRGQTASLKSDNLSHKKENGEVWFKFYFWQVWSALLWAASSKPLQMLPFDPLCLKSLSHFSLKQRMKDLFSVIELMSYHQAVWTEQNRCWYFTTFQIGVFMKIVQREEEGEIGEEYKAKI